MSPLFFFLMQVWTNKERGGEVNSYDYDLEFKDNKIILKNSNNVEWTEPGSKAGYIEDDGDGLVIKLRGYKTISLDYAQALELLILLLAEHEEKIEIRETKTIKSI